MKTTAILAVLVLSIFVVSPAIAQVQSLSVATSATRPVVDGVVSTGEYSAPLVVGKTSLSVARTADALTVALSVETQGWVAIGFGSSRMDKATILIGFVRNGKLELRSDLGRGQSHATVAFDSLIASTGTEANGRTTIEISVKPAALITQGQKELPIIVAYGTADSFVSPHAARWSGLITWAE